MSQRLAGVVRWELLLLFLVSPLLLFPNSTYGLGMGIVPALWGLRRWVTGRFIVPTPLDIPILVLLTMTGVGQIVSADPAFSLAKSAGIVLGIGTYYAVVAMAEGGGDSRLALLLFMGMNLGVAGISLFATAWGTKFPLFEPILSQLPRLNIPLPGSTPEGFNPNGVAGIFLFGLPLWGLLSFTAPPALFAPLGRFAWLGRIAIAFVTLFILLLFIATQSRAGYASLGVAVLLLFLLPRPRWLGAGVVMGIVALLLFWVSPYQASFIARLTTPAASDGALSTLSGRFELWERGIQAVQDFPLTGVGLGMFRFIQPRLYPLYPVPVQPDIGHVHNQFLQAGLDVGVPGLIAFISLWGGATLLGMRVLWHHRTAMVHPLTLGVLAGWVGHFLWATIEVHALGSKGGWFWWWSLALLVAFYLQSRGIRESRGDPGNSVGAPSRLQPS